MITKSFMDSNKWCFNDKWDKAEQKNFFEELKKVKGKDKFRGIDNKAHCLFIKAVKLFKSENKYKVKEAIKLLSKSVNDFPSEFNKLDCFKLLADCYAFLGEEDKTIYYFEKTLEKELSSRKAYTGAATDYPEYIVKNKIKDYYPRAKKILEDTWNDGKLNHSPKNFFLYFGLLSVIEYWTKKKKTKFIDEALKFVESPGIKYPKFSGLAEKSHWLVKELKKIKK